MNNLYFCIMYRRCVFPVLCQSRAGFRPVTAAGTHFTASSLPITTALHYPHKKKAHMHWWLHAEQEQSMTLKPAPPWQLTFSPPLTTTLWMTIRTFLNFDHRTNNTDNLLPLIILSVASLLVVNKHRHDKTWKEITRSIKRNTDPCSTLELPGELYAPSHS